MTNKSLSFRIAPPVFLSITRSNPSFIYNLLSDSEVANLLRFSGYGQFSGGLFVHPPEYFHGLPVELNVHWTYSITRAPMIVIWAIFSVVMMWIISLLIFISAVDFVIFRPRVIPPILMVAPVTLM